MNAKDRKIIDCILTAIAGDEQLEEIFTKEVHSIYPEMTVDKFDDWIGNVKVRTD